MKKILYISFLILFLVGCNQLQSNDFSQENTIEDRLVQKTDTLTKISEPFKVNDVECYWKVSIIMEEGDYEGGYITRELINNETQKTILKDIDFYHFDGYNDIDFEEEKENFKDINFDKFKDYIVLNYSNSSPLNNFYNIHIFNNNTKSFDFSQELSNTEIEIDSLNRKVTSSYGYREYSSYTVHHFEKNGKLKFSEEFSEQFGHQDTLGVLYKFYQKIVNGEVIETKRDSIIEKW